MKPIWYWLFPLCVIVLAVYVAYRNYPWVDEAEKWIGLVIALIATRGGVLLSLGLALGLSLFIGKHADQIWHECWRGRMVSLRSADGIQGRIAGGIFLMSGLVESRQTYFYYTLNRDGSFKPGRWNPDSDTSIYEEDRKDGEVIQFDGQFKHPWVEWFGETDSRLRMDFRIPKGSLHQTFAIE